jgi:hypothetical protein
MSTSKSKTFSTSYTVMPPHIFSAFPSTVYSMHFTKNQALICSLSTYLFLFDAVEISWWPHFQAESRLAARKQEQTDCKKGDKKIAPQRQEKPVVCNHSMSRTSPKCHSRTCTTAVSLMSIKITESSMVKEWGSVRFRKGVDCSMMFKWKTDTLKLTETFEIIFLRKSEKQSVF